MSSDHSLPEPLPVDPLPLFASWLNDASERRMQPNPDAMLLATVDGDGHPAARVVLCKRLNAEAGYLAFFTNYESRKGRELSIHPRAAAVFHWDALHRQVRVEGPVIRSPEWESEAYFASRPLDSRVGAWASAQSEPLPSRGALIEKVRQAATRFAIQPGASAGAVPRPPYWGGYRLWIESIELWAEGANRLHDRAVWRRALQRQDSFTLSASTWHSTRLNP